MSLKPLGGPFRFYAFVVRLSAAALAVLLWLINLNPSLGRDFEPGEVFQIGDGFQVLWIDAAAVTTQVVDDQAFGYGALVVNDPRDSVGDEVIATQAKRPIALRCFVAGPLHASEICDLVLVAEDALEPPAEQYFKVVLIGHADQYSFQSGRLVWTATLAVASPQVKPLKIVELRGFETLLPNAVLPAHGRFTGW